MENDIQNIPLRPSPGATGARSEPKIRLDERGFIFHNGKYYKLVHRVTSKDGTVHKTTLQPEKYKEVYERTSNFLQKKENDLPSLKLLINKQEITSQDVNIELDKGMKKDFRELTNLILEISKTTTEPEVAEIVVQEKKSKSPLTKLSKKISTNWQRFVNFIDTKQKESRLSSLQDDLTKLFGKNFPLDTQKDVIEAISSNKNLYSEFHDFLKLAGKIRKENLKNLQEGAQLNRDDSNFMGKKMILERSLSTALDKFTDKEQMIDSLIGKIQDSAGMVDTLSVRNLLDSANEPVLVDQDITPEHTAFSEEQLVSRGFEQWGIEGQYAKFEMKNKESIENTSGEQIFTKGDFVLSYAIPEEEIRQITINLDLSPLKIKTLEHSKKILELLKITLSIDPAVASLWLQIQGEPLPLDDESRKQNELRDEVREFLGEDDYLRFVYIAKSFCDQAYANTGKALMSLGHPKLNLSDVVTKTFDQQKREAIRLRVTELSKKNGLNLLDRINDLTLADNGVLKLKGDLKPDEKLISFPEGLEVEGNLDLRDCTHLTTLPESLKVGGELYLLDKVDLTKCRVPRFQIHRIYK